MAWRYHGHASVDPDNLKGASWATCDRCGSNHNLRNLRFQHQWAGPSLINLRLLVCERCLDIPSAFLRTPVLPPDPPPIFNARPEAYSIDETDYRVTTNADIRETEAPLDEPRVVEHPPTILGPAIGGSDLLASDGSEVIASDGSSISL